MTVGRDGASGREILEDLRESVGGSSISLSGGSERDEELREGEPRRNGVALRRNGFEDSALGRATT